ncbi:hypothetical protein [Nocardioides campestrisoli]|uniref:hypothetical protein n=1 Tax=Nocardioides campestrisoli TaxID=2736757 RepID=UPI0015E6F662|nr:hypothetical protein [Nocardioides campestrisoli]
MRGGLAQALASGAMLVLMLGACGDDPDPAKSSSALSSAKERVESRFRDAVDVLAGAGFEVADADAEWRMCGVDPSPSMQVLGGGRLTGGEGDVAARVAAAADALESAGWKVENAGETPRPYAVLADGEGAERVQLSVTESRRTPGRIGLQVGGACIESATEDSNERMGQKFTLL